MPSPTWTVTEYPFQQPIGVLAPQMTLQGLVAAVAADGSALYTVTFPQAYTNTVVVDVSIEESAPTYKDYFPRAVNVTLSGFQIYVTGGAVGTFTPVAWISSGN